MGLIDQLKNALGLGPKTYAGVVYPTSYAAAAVVRVPTVAMSPTNDVGSTESASLVSSTGHKRGISSDNRSSLIDGR